MTRLVVDSWAWLEYFEGSPKGKEVEGLVQGAELWTSAVSVAEIVSRYKRSGKDPARAVQAVTTLSKVSTPALDDAVDAGTIHSEVKQRSRNMSLADAFVLQLARKVDAKVLTGDPDFRGMAEAILVG